MSKLIWQTKNTCQSYWKTIGQLLFFLKTFELYYSNVTSKADKIKTAVTKRFYLFQKRWILFWLYVKLRDNRNNYDMIVLQEECNKNEIWLDSFCFTSWKENNGWNILSRKCTAIKWKSFSFTLCWRNKVACGFIVQNKWYNLLCSLFRQNH